MNRLIDANELKQAALGLGEDVVCDGCTCEFLNLIDAQPTIEAEPVRHGHWEIKKVWSPAFPPIERPFCSLCGGRGSTSALYGYCPYCGSRMDEVIDDG